MPAPRGRKRKSGQSTTSSDDQGAQTRTQMVATKTDEGPSEESPRKRRKVGITITQKQALIDNLQLEITERARKLRAHYNIHAQSLRTRIEIRVNRIPLALRKARMGDLLMKYSEQQQKPGAAPTAVRNPPVPEKDIYPAGRAGLHRVPTSSAPLASPSRPLKRLSDEISGGDKENETDKIDNPKKKVRGGAAAAAAMRGNNNNPSQVLSPTTSNSRMVAPPRDRAAASPGKSLIARPVSPTKTGSSSNILSNMVEKARSTRAAAATRKTTMSSTTSSSTNGGPAPPPATRARRGAAAAAGRAPASSRTTRRASGVSESSDGSTATVVKRRTGAAAPKTAAPAPAPAPAAKRTVMGTIRKGVTAGTTRKAPAARTAAAAAAPAAGTGRVLRKRT
ncbi:Borealin N terminal-domain-containing protein [Phialemonium atrogriseum]|uniref:Borealin N terminal-domain-containing protein n=1 Tax=Phialemonium atrogriseum TaxID=1093897 RepID=A0AAJ0C4P8_9PEZI|nr:Borealin N terminal-domain-containing protein [Phialemonium atrogriseum]KAK1769457.1 Borealin N terminal-domain-containing protein [Phialemonium atrogriseum]